MPWHLRDLDYPLPLQVSASLVWLADSGTQQILYAMGVQGQSFFAASGDNGSHNAPGPFCNAFYSSYTTQNSLSGVTLVNDLALDNVTVVGGTLWASRRGQLRLPWNASIPWSDGSSSTGGSGGGILSGDDILNFGVPIPTYQWFALEGNKNGASNAWQRPA